MFLACLLFLNNFQRLLSGQKKPLTLPAVLGVTCQRPSRVRKAGSGVPGSRVDKPQPGWILRWRSQSWRHFENQVHCGILHRLKEAWRRGVSPIPGPGGSLCWGGWEHGPLGSSVQEWTMEARTGPL